MRIEDKLKTIKNEIPKSPTYMKQKVMDLIKSPSKLHNKKTKLNLYRLIPILSVSVLLIVLLIVGITYNKTNEPNANLDGEVNDLIYESKIDDYLSYQITIDNKEYSFNDEVILLINYGYKDINNNFFNNILITVEASGFTVIGEEDYLITDINNNDNQVIFKLKLNDNNNTNGNITINFKSIITNGDYNEDLEEVFNAKLEINYNSIPSGIEFKGGNN